MPPGHRFAPPRLLSIQRRSSDLVLVSAGIYHETIRIRTDDLSVGGNRSFPTIGGISIEAIGVSVGNFNVFDGGIVASTLPRVSNCTEVSIGGNLVNSEATATY